MKGQDVIRKRISVVQKVLATSDGIELMDMLEESFGGDTFDRDPYLHAFNAGQRSILIWLTTYDKAKVNVEEFEVPI